MKTSKKLEGEIQSRRGFLWWLGVGAGAVVGWAGWRTYEMTAGPLEEVAERPVQPGTNTATGTTQGLTWEQFGGSINDASRLDRTPIFGVVRIKTEDDVRTALAFARSANLHVTAAGQRHSMGGQAFSKGGVVLDMRGMHDMQLDTATQILRVSSGATWAAVQSFLDTQGFSVAAMQSINIFTVGGSLSVNGHGIAHRPGPIASTVRSLRLMLWDGRVVTASANENAELLQHAIGGYGLFGVILDAELQVVKNEMYTREIRYMSCGEFVDHYRSQVDANDQVGLFYGRISVSPTSFLEECEAYLYRKTAYEGAVAALSTVNHDSVDRLVINFSKTGAVGRWLRWVLEKRVEKELHTCIPRSSALTPKDACVVSRNQEMYDSMGYLKNRLRDTDILQEYFVPLDRMTHFVDGLREIVRMHGANLLNVTLRIVHEDTISTLAYARGTRVALVLYFNQMSTKEETRTLMRTTVDLIDLAASCGGTFYLPYRLDYSKAQLARAYPQIDEFFTLKRKYDPGGLFSNAFYERYGI